MKATRTKYFWISIAPSKSFVTIGWLRRGKFSLKYGGFTGIPAHSVRPGELSSEGTRELRTLPTCERADGRILSRSGREFRPPGEANTPSFTFGSTARKMWPKAPPPKE